MGCGCEAFEFKKRRKCWHIQRVTEFQSYALTMVVMERKRASANDNKARAKAKSTLVHSLPKPNTEPDPNAIPW